MFVTFEFHQIFKRLTIIIEQRLPISKIWRVNFLMLFWIQLITYFFETYKYNKNIWDALGISGLTKLPNANIIEDYTIDEDDMTDVLTLGHMVDKNSCLVVLSSTCIIILLKSNILPNYKLFQFVNWGNNIYN